MKNYKNTKILNLLSFKYEIILTVLSLLIFILSLINIGIKDTYSLIFNILLLIDIPFIYLSFYTIRRLMIKIYGGYIL